MVPLNRFTITPLLGCLLVLVVYSFFPLQHPPVHHQPIHASNPQATLQTPTAKVAKVSVIYGDLNECYYGAIRTHQRHADRHGYPFHILRNPVAEGYWNKAEYLHSILVQELGKPTDDRVEWLMWVDADSAIINPEIPVEVFLPPPDFPEIHFLASKDQNGLNTGIFFCRVHPWSINMFTKTLGFPMFKPEVDLGYSADQTAMALLFNETENQPHVMYQPRTWYNTYQFHHGYEGKPGDLLVHFPGLEDDRWSQMGAWLATLEDPFEAMKWSMPVAQTHYPRQIETFWEAVRVGTQVLELANEAYEENFGDLALATVIRNLEFALFYETDQPHLMEQAIEQATYALEQ